MPGLDGISVACKLREIMPDLRLVMLTLHDEASARRRAHAAGINAFVSKNGADAQLLAAIRGQRGDPVAQPSPPFGGDGVPPKVRN
jgi:two-component system response regulator DesR